MYISAILVVCYTSIDFFVNIIYYILDKLQKGIFAHFAVLFILYYTLKSFLCLHTANFLYRGFSMTTLKERENKTEKIERAYRFWKGFYSLHLYPTKGEAFAKAILITISWIGGVHSANPLVASCFFLFSLSIVMEYCVKLVTSEKLIPKILPFILIGLNLLVCFFSFKDLFSVTTDVSFLSTKNIVLKVTLGILWADTFAMLLIEEPATPKPIEAQLKNC